MQRRYKVVIHTIRVITVVKNKAKESCADYNVCYI